ncbi:MAG TPA: 4a-hydroxytetrahydrobiopterin dehydratase [Chiayiivirga sp.]|nr:4a-hydroxytetrahydrobiopterin dehydratase [Chiayiivirga sp.]
MTTLAALAARSCRPLNRGTEAFAPDAARALLALLPGWELVENGAAIARTFRFPDYYRTLAFVNAMAFIAHREDHHPDLGVHYDRCVVRYSSHDVGGLSDNDFICAAKVSLLTGDAT